MRPWELLGQTRTPDGEDMSLTRQGSEYVILASGKPLMSSRMHGSEEALAAFGCRDARLLDEPCVLVAGLGAHVHHWNANLMIQPTADGASGQVYLVLVDFANKPATIATSATYSDELVKTAQGWRFKKRTTKGDVAPPAAPKP